LKHGAAARSRCHGAEPQEYGARAKKLGVSLRPHIKTHKCLELGRRQLEHGAQGITVSTLFEAQSFARGGFTDVTWAFPLDPSHVSHVQRIAREG